MVVAPPALAAGGLRLGSRPVSVSVRARRQPTLRQPTHRRTLHPKPGGTVWLLPPLLVKPGCTFDEFLDRGLGQPQSCAAETIADEVKDPLDPAD
jgi:hypothetical protein